MELNNQPVRQRRTAAAIVWEFLGSMNLAITLLVVIAIASIIGTVLQQNEPYTNYVMKFGPFWFEAFKALGLYDIYGAPWFIALLGFLLISTSLCVWRNTPVILRDMRHFRLDVQEKSLRGFHLKAQWQTSRTVAEASGRGMAVLAAQGYRVRSRDHGDHHMVAAMKGSAGRLGYILTHLAIVVICLGGLIDGNLPLKWKEMRGELKVETRDLSALEVPAESTLGIDNLSFRGSATIPEGSRADFVYLPLRDGYLLQKLPFTIAVEDFRIEHYPSGMPKSFESDLLIFDDELKEPLRKTIAVNHPLIYKGYAIYQSSFSDGGSELKLRAWPLDAAGQEPVDLASGVNRYFKLNTPHGQRTVEFIDFKQFNIFPVAEDDTSGKKFRNYGPSFVFKVRNPAGEALEYVNYMLPVEIEGRPFFMTGMRDTPSQEYRYLYFPIDAAGGIERFVRLLTVVNDEAKVRAAVQRQIDDTVAANRPDTKQLRETMLDSIVRLAGLFVDEGIDGLVRHVEATVPEDKRQDAINSYVSVLQGVVGLLYIDLLRAEGQDVEQGISEADAQYFDEAMNTLSILGHYGSPFYLQLTEFKHVEATGLQITRSPGKDVVYLGCSMLMLGIFLMFYLHHRRVWLRLAPAADGAVEVLFAGSGSRSRLDFEHEFSALQVKLEQHLGGNDSNAVR